MKRGTRVGQAYVSLTVDGDGINEDIVHEVDGAGPGVEKAGEDHGDRYSEGFFTRMRSRLKSRFDDERGVFSDFGSKDGDSAGQNFADRFAASLRKHLGDADSNGAFVGGISNGFKFAGEKSGEDFADRIVASARKRLERDAGQLGSALERGVSRNTKSSSVGDRVGDLLGSGSRNNFLNFFGNALGGIVNLAEKGRRATVGLFSAFSEGAQKAGENATNLEKGLAGISGVGSKLGSSLSAGLESLAASGPAVAVAIAVVLVALSALASIISALIALVTALVATITSGLVAALLVGSAGLLALVAAGGLAVAMFTSLTDAQKKALGLSFAPLKDEVAGLGQLMLAQVIPAFDTWSGNLQKALYLLAPLASVLGQSFADAGNIITASLSGPGFQSFIDSLGTYLPQIITTLSSAFGGFLNGALAVFAVVMPYVLQFSSTLNDLATKFSNFANSPEGNNAIIDFVDRAVTSLDSLWGAVQQVFGFIFDLLFSPQAQSAGNTIFDGIASTFENLRANLAAAAADGSLQKWFDDAINFGSALWETIKGLISIFLAFYNSGLLGDISSLLASFGKVLQKVSGFVEGAIAVLDGLAFPVFTAVKAFKVFGSAVGTVFDAMRGRLNQSSRDTDTWANHVNAAISTALSSAAFAQQFSAAAAAGSGTLPHTMTLAEILAQGHTANANSNLPKPTVPKAPKIPKYKNPYVKYANSLIKENNTIADQIRKAMTDMNNKVTDALASAGTATTAKAANDTIKSTVDSIASSAQTVVDSAQSGLNSAAQSLASATSKKAAKAALAQVKAAQTALASAQAAQSRAINAQNILNAQQSVNADTVYRIVHGLGAQNITLAELADARGQVADLLDDANKKLADALQVRDNYAASVTNAALAFGALTTAQAKTINGIQQSLTATDITANLQDRLDKIRAFQHNIDILRAQGLSDAAYKQIIDAGIEGGSAYAQALVDGGVGSVQQVNGLLDQIGSVSDALGTNAANSMYQAGVAAAQGLVDGLNAISDQIEIAATNLGNAIATAVRNALGIASPSRVMIGYMSNVGDGLTLGLAAQHSKVAAAASALSDQIAVSPEVANYAGAQDHSPYVSGNGTSGSVQSPFRDLHVHTPSRDPRVVALEVFNETSGRLP